MYKVLILLALSLTVMSYNKNAIPKGTHVFGQWIFIYDSVNLTPGKGLKGQLPEWMLNGGANMASLAFLAPRELSASPVLPEQMLNALASAQNSTIHLMMSIGGADLASLFAWADPTQSAKNAATIAQKYGVGIEIDVEDDNEHAWVDTFIQTYRSIIPAGGSGMESILTVDIGCGITYLTDIENVAKKYLGSGDVDWVNIMVNTDDSQSNTQLWDQHTESASQVVVSRYLDDTCNDSGSLSWALDYTKNGEKVKGVMSWAALSDIECKAKGENQNCGTGCTDCTAGVSGGKYEFDCPAHRAGCASFVGQCSSTAEGIAF